MHTNLKPFKVPCKQKISIDYRRIIVELFSAKSSFLTTSFYGHHFLLPSETGLAKLPAIPPINTLVNFYHRFL